MYKLISADSCKSLNTKVNNAIMSGWKLYGHPFCRNKQYFQTMTIGKLRYFIKMIRGNNA